MSQVDKLLRLDYAPRLCLSQPSLSPVRQNTYKTSYHDPHIISLQYLNPSFLCLVFLPAELDCTYSILHHYTLQNNLSTLFFVHRICKLFQKLQNHDSLEFFQVSDGSQLVQGVTIVQRSFLSEHPDAVQRFVKEHADSVQAANADPKAVAPLVVSAGILDSEEVIFYKC